MKIANRTGESSGRAPASLHVLECFRMIGFACVCGSVVNVRVAHKVAKLRARRDGTPQELATIGDEDGCGMCAVGLRPSHVPRVQRRQHEWIRKVQSQEALLIDRPRAVNDETWTILGGHQVDLTMRSMMHRWTVEPE